MAKRKSKGRLPPFIPVIRSTAASPAWKAMSMGARCLYIVLAGYVSTDGRNNGKVYRSHRDACSDLGTRSRASIARWFQEIEHYGFAVKTYEGCLGVDGYGEAPHWRLTEYPTQDSRGYHVAPTRDFDRWDGVLFSPRRRPPSKSESRPHDEDTLSPWRGHMQHVQDVQPCPHDEAIYSSPEVSSPQGHILVTTPLPSLIGHNSKATSLFCRPTPVTDAVGPRLRSPVARATQAYTGYSSLPIELRMLSLGLPVIDKVKER